MKSADEFWASFFGLSISEFLLPESRVVPHAGLRDYHGLWLFRRGPKVIISAPPQLVFELTEVFQPLINKTDAYLADEGFIESLGDKVDKAIGPAFQAFLPEEEFHPVSSEARLLAEQDEYAVEDLRAACDHDEWENSDVEAGRHPIFGCFIKDQLVAVATYRIEDGAAFPGLITHPHFRGRGFGKSTLSKATEHGLNNNLLMLYQTLLANQAAIAVAQSLGYKPYATHLAIRLK
jgi:GNAT superfamily N-acetyltransferase